MKVVYAIVVGIGGLIIGGSIGYAMGLAVGKETNSVVGENTKTSIYNGVVTVQVDAKNAAKQGLTQAWDKFKGGS